MFGIYKRKKDLLFSSPCPPHQLHLTFSWAEKGREARLKVCIHHSLRHFVTLHALPAWGRDWNGCLCFTRRRVKLKRVNGFWPPSKISAKPRLGRWDFWFHGSPLSSLFFFHTLTPNYFLLLVKNMHLTCFISTSQNLSRQTGPEWNFVFSHLLLTSQGAKTESLRNLCRECGGERSSPCSSFGELSTSLLPLINQPLTTNCLWCNSLILSEQDSSFPSICPTPCPASPIFPTILFGSHPVCPAWCPQLC